MVRPCSCPTSDKLAKGAKHRLGNRLGITEVGCERLMSVPGIGPIIFSAMVAEPPYSPGSTALPKRPVRGENSTAQVAAATAAPMSCAAMKPGT
jgi:hypothetical protein